MLAGGTAVDAEEEKARGTRTNSDIAVPTKEHLYVRDVRGAVTKFGARSGSGPGPRTAPAVFAPGELRRGV